MATREYAGDGITVHWDSERCTHSERCFTAGPAIFDPRARPWVDVDGSTADDIARVIDGCPSGALTYTRTDGSPHGRRGYAEGTDPSAALTPDGTPPADPASTPAGPPDGEIAPVVVVTPRENGPLLVEGPVTLTAADGTTSSSDRLFLCRCGDSATKPLCDGTHKKAGFTAPGVAPTSRTPS